MNLWLLKTSELHSVVLKTSELHSVVDGLPERLTWI